MRCIPLLALLTSLACGAKSTEIDDPEKPTSDASTDPEKPDPEPVLSRLHVALEYVVIDDTEDPVTSRVSLIFTDETGATRRDITGEFPGGCSDVTLAARAEELKPLLGLDCFAGDEGVHLRYVHRKNKLYVVKAPADRSGAAPSYQPVKEIDLPPGTPLGTDYDGPKADAGQ